MSTVSKILERLMLTRLRPHLLQSTNFRKYQSAYRKGHSTETALLEILDGVYTAADDKQVTVLISFDLSVAFDTVDHEVLLQRLQSEFGVTDTPLFWLRSYLESRTQFVKIGQHHSPAVGLDVGVPRGSVLGPLLFAVTVFSSTNTPTTHSFVSPCLLAIHPTVCLYSLRVLLRSDNGTHETGCSSTRTIRRHSSLALLISCVPPTQPSHRYASPTFSYRWPTRSKYSSGFRQTRYGGDPVVQFPYTSHPPYMPSIVDRSGTGTGLQSDPDETRLLQLGTLRRASQQHPEQCSQNRPPGTEAVPC